jgi:hypothetical protein
VRGHRRHGAARLPLCQPSVWQLRHQVSSSISDELCRRDEARLRAAPRYHPP